MREHLEVLVATRFKMVFLIALGVVNRMQIIANCILEIDDNVLVLRKPRRGWWVAPGGKVERGESPYQAVIREYREETGLSIEDPQLRGVFTILVYDGDELADHWMMFTYHSKSFHGTRLQQSPEGELDWKAKQEALALPMAEGDRVIFQHILNHAGASVIHGTFSYTKDMELISWREEPESVLNRILTISEK
jgi:8-oxo-dGTP diphosphatase